MSLSAGHFGVGWTALGVFAPATPLRALDDAEARPLPLVEVWYPAAAAGKRSVRSGWWPTRRAVRDSPVAAGSARFPVLIYNSGWPGTDIENHFLIETLASHGYVVAALTYPSHRGYLRRPVDFSSAAAYQNAIVQVTRRVRIRASDSIAVFDELGRLDSAHGVLPFARRLDTTRLGLFGFSLGGAIAAEAATLDPRVQAVVNIDGRHWGTALEAGVSQPYLFIGEKLVQPTEADLTSVNADRRYNAILDRHDYAQLARNLLRNGGIQVEIDDAQHMNFTDGALRPRLWRGGQFGAVDARLALDTLAAYVNAFFGQTLCGNQADILGPESKPLRGSLVHHWPRPPQRLSA